MLPSGRVSGEVCADRNRRVFGMSVSGRMTKRIYLHCHVIIFAIKSLFFTFLDLKAEVHHGIIIQSQSEEHCLCFVDTNRDSTGANNLILDDMLPKENIFEYHSIWTGGKPSCSIDT
jgi:hypothetical protein